MPSDLLPDTADEVFAVSVSILNLSLIIIQVVLVAIVYVEIWKVRRVTAYSQHQL
jgi:hypothetical protein